MKNEKSYGLEGNNTINDKLQHFVDSYLRGILLLGGFITIGLGSMFFGEKVMGVGIIALLCGFFYHSFGGLIRKFLHLALAAIVLGGATAHLCISKLAALVREKQGDARAETKQDSAHVATAKAEHADPVETFEEEDEPVFKRVVLDGDIEPAPEENAAETLSSSAMKPKFKGAEGSFELAADFSGYEDEEEILRAGMDREEEYYGTVMAAEFERAAQASMSEALPAGFIPNEDIPDEKPLFEAIPDEVAFAHDDNMEGTAHPVVVHPRKVTQNRLPNGMRVIARTSGHD